MSAKLVIHLNVGPERDSRDLERASANLRAELRRVNGVESVEPLPAGDAPSGSRAVDTQSIGSILMTLAASGGVLNSLIGVLREWLGRGQKRSVTFQIGPDKLELTGYPIEEQKQLVEIFLNKLKDNHL